MEFIFTVVFRGLFFCTAAHFKIYSHSQIPIFPFSKPVQVLLGKKWKKVKPFLSCQSVPCQVISLQESHLKYAPVCQGSTCKQSAARSETPKAWLPCCKAVGRKKDPPAITQITSLVLFSRLPGNSLQLPLKFNCHIAMKLFTTHRRTKTHRIEYYF